MNSSRSDRGNLSLVATSPQDATDAAFWEALVVILERYCLLRTTPAEVAAEPWLTVAEAAAYVSVSETTVRSWIRDGRLPSGRFGRVLRIRRADIDALFLSQAVCPRGSSELSPVERARAIVAKIKSKGAQDG